MGMPGGTELLIIFGIVILLFGAKKIPDLAKGIGKGIKNFKAEMKDDTTEDVSAKATHTEAPKKVEGSEETASTETPKTTKEA
jgi:sec-independent protein translocase protein TatA